MKKLFLILCLTSPLAFADDPHHEHDDSLTEITKIINNTSESDTKGVASAIAAAQCQFDFGTYRTQGCLSVGRYDGHNAVNFGVGKRFSKNRVLINGSVALEDNEPAVGSAVNWRF